MKLYYYLLFSIYMFYKNRMKETQMLLFYTTVLSSLLISFNILSIMEFLNVWQLTDFQINKWHILFGALLLNLFNYYFVIRKELFLKYNFKNSIKGGLLVILYIILTAIFTILSANSYRF